jgi:hypothetical protein
MKRLFALAIGMLAPLLASAADVAIPRQALGTSLQQLAKQSGIQIIFFSKVVEGHEALPLNGTFTPEAALDRLLAGTNLTYHALNERTIEVSAGARAASVPWEPLPGSEPPLQDAPDAPLAEVEITAERAPLSEMRAQILQLENQFYARYNQVNANHQYDVIVCRSLRYTGSHVDRRSCGPASLLAVVPYLDAPSYGLTPARGVSLSVETPKDPAQLRAYQRNMVGVVRKHPELLELIKKRSELVERYQLERYRATREQAMRERETRGREGALRP